MANRDVQMVEDYVRGEFGEVTEQMVAFDNIKKENAKMKEGIKALTECLSVMGMNNFTKKGYIQFLAELLELAN